MITIISELNDITTSSFVRFCNSRGCNVSRINCNINPIDFYNKLLDISGPIWIRRFYFPKFGEVVGSKINDDINKYKSFEIREVFTYILDSITHFKLGNYKVVRVNKLQTLKYAASIGLKIPEFIISNNYFEITSFCKEYESVIVKSSYEPYDGYGVASYTELFKIETLKRRIPKFPSLFQEKIEKKVEIRSLYICGSFYSMAIFSQKNEKTKVDFRNYDYLTPNRLSPYTLPSNIENCLKILMDQLELNFGIIDLILSPNNEYYFLEVNPVGQFEDIMKICNYNIFQHILDILGNETIK